MNKKILTLSLFCIGLAALHWFLWMPHHSTQLTLVMLNIGQGDAIYIRTPLGNDILVDCGPDRTVLSELGAAMPPFDHQIEYLVATHADSDHIAGCMEVTDAYAVQHLITNGHGKDTHVAEQFAIWTQQQRLTPTIVRRGNRIDIEPNVWLEVLNPSDQEHPDTNDDSVVLILHDRDVRIALTGDLPSTIEDEIMAAYPPEALNIDLLKVGHHGSHFSTSDAWLQVTTPQIALISAGIHNRYHHPHPTVVHRLKTAEILTYRTDMQGRITCRSDGTTITCAPQHN